MTRVMLVGNPNAGKTSLFNRLTGARQKVGNWPGVTVERKEGWLNLGTDRIQLIDLPGIYSLELSHPTQDEALSCQQLAEGQFDWLINIVDATHLERHLYLSIQLRELNRPMLVVINMLDKARQAGLQLDLAELEARLGCPVLAISANTGEGLVPLQQALREPPVMRPFRLPLPAALEQALSVAPELSLAQRLVRLEAEQPGQEWGLQLADARYQFILQLLADCEQRSEQSLFSDRLDAWVLHPVAGWLIFFAALYALFFCAIEVSGIFIDAFDGLAESLFVRGLDSLLAGWGLSEGLRLWTLGLGSGLQLVASFIPVIGCLYLGLAFLEDSGYMARAALLMDRSMSRLGLSGKAFVPLILGFGCNVPAVMACRTLPVLRQRILVGLMVPFMSCGARLAVYALFVATFFPEQGIWVVLALYLTGILCAVLTAWIAQLLWPEQQPEALLLDLPAYHLPKARNLLQSAWNNIQQFAVGAGKLIILVVLGLSLLQRLDESGQWRATNDPAHSLLASTAKRVTPVFEPMGLSHDNWPAVVGLLTGVLAKEVVVGTLRSLYEPVNATDAPYEFKADLAQAWHSIADNSRALLERLNPWGEPAETETPLAAMKSLFGSGAAVFAYLVFILLYCPCVATLAALSRELGKAWMWCSFVWSTLLAYVLAICCYQLARAQFIGPLWLIAGLVGFLWLIRWSLNLTRRENVTDASAR